MKTYAPNYYEKFRCIAGECRHSCCIGWDVYIDDETLEKYDTLGGETGKVLRSQLTEKEDGVCLAMCEGGKCPMLNTQGLCQIILEHGESYISEICREHPRFYNFFSDRTEVGLGLSCEEAARIILSQEEKTELTVVSEDEAEEEELWDDEADILVKRAQIFDALQNRGESLSARAEKMLSVCGAHFPEKTAAEWAEIFRSLEMLDESWADALDMLEHADMSAEMEELALPLEQLLVYFVYRHTPEAADERDFAARVAFAHLGFTVIRALCAAKKAASGKCTLAYLCDFARRYSAEIEYSPENTYELIEIMEV